MTIETIKANILAKKAEILAKTTEIENFEILLSDVRYDDILDADGEVSVSGLSFYPSAIIKNCDPVAYRCGKSDYEYSLDKEDQEEYQDLQAELEELENDLAYLESDLEDAEENEK